MKKITEPSRIVTDKQMLAELARQGIDKDYVEFERDYCPAHPSTKFYRDLKSGKRFAVISDYPRVNKDGKRIVAKWLRKDSKYVANSNVF